MAKERPLPPVWLMGMGFFPLGASGTVTVITIPQLLAAQHVPEPQIASIEAIALLPGFISFVFGPLLDWRYSRRAYAIGFTLVAGVCMLGSLLSTSNLTLLTWLMFAVGMAIGMVVSAVGGWFGNLTPTEDKAKLGAWFVVANLGAGGIVATVAIPLLRDLPYLVGACIISATIVAALPLYLWTPCPPADGRLASESVKAFARDVVQLLKRPTVLWTLPLFLAPSASFSLTNIVAGLGHDFATSEQMVALIGGLGVAIAGVIGSLAVPRLAEKVNPRTLYLLVGGVGAAFSLSLIALGRTPVTYGVFALGENVFQAAAFSVGNVIILRTIGHDNPLAATQFGLLNGASSLPLVYMQAIDGQAYGKAGVVGSYLADALISGGACILLGLMLWVWRKKIPAI